jgi:hypothetical protein
MKIEKLWFDNERIFVTNEKGETLSQSLKFYPRLLVATDAERENYEFEPFGIHWEQIDEDVSYESFYYEDTKEPLPGIQDAFLSHPELNVSAVARRMGIQQSLLASYIKGVKTPSDERKKFILDTIHEIGKSLQDVTF